MVATSVRVDTISSIDPATGRVLGSFEKTSPLTVPELMAKARAAQSHWANLATNERRGRIRELQRQILIACEGLADAVVRESGKPRTEAIFADIFVALDTAGYFAKKGTDSMRPERVAHHNIAAKAKSGTIYYEPLGVLGIISSWNYPLAIPLSQIIAAVAVGNAVLCKTSDVTPECGVLIEKLVRHAGFPNDLITVLQGGGEIGQALIEAHPDKIFFTGSVETGRKIAEACARQLIPSVLELGGKDAMLVLRDANLEVASSAAVWGSFTNCGQVCLSVERLFVEQAVADEFIRRCVEKTQKLRIGPGSDPATDLGPLIRPQHVQRMVELVGEAVQGGARVVCGGRARPELGPNFFEPTILTGVNKSMRLFQDETFGPIMAIEIVKDADEAVRQANDTEFSLSASVWTGDTSQGKSIARRLRAGTVMVNDLISAFAIAEAPHGGSGLSGWGRTHGKAGIAEMVSVKYVDVDRLPGLSKPWWFRYGAELQNAADAFLKFEFGGSVASRTRNARAALKMMFRNHGF
jgi:succinate-semialdehyde dehydrogenase/glutarate-semialdehyde dehydrogenase